LLTQEAVVAKQFIAPILILIAGFASAEEIPNPLIDYQAFKEGVARVGEIRENHRVTENEFMIMAADPKTIILDARSREMFELLHVMGAKNLCLPDISETELARVLPSKSTRGVIYCYNNFLNEREAFPSKSLSASLNVYTMNVLHAYGYTNVYELGPLIDIRKTVIPFERGRRVAAVTQ
jgi:hypothetical protein